MTNYANGNDDKQREGREEREGYVIMTKTLTSRKIINKEKYKSLKERKENKR